MQRHPMKMQDRLRYVLKLLSSGPGRSDGVGIHWGRERVVVVVDPRDGKPARSFTIDLTSARPADASNVGERLKQKLEEEGVRTSGVAVTLPLSEALVHNLQLPPSQDAELPELVRYQLAAKSTIPVESLLFDFLPERNRQPSDECRVLIVALLKERVDAIRSVLGSAGLELHRIGLDCLSALTHVEHDSGGNSGSEGGPCLLVIRQGRRFGLVKSTDEGIGYLRTATQRTDEPLEKALLRISRHSVMEIESERCGSASPEKVCMLNCGLNPQQRKKLQAALRLTVSAARFNKQFTAADETDSGFAEVAALGVLAREQTNAVDFLNPRHTKRAASRKGRTIALCAAAGVAAILVGISVVRSRRSGLDAKIQAVTQDLNDAEIKLAGSQSLLLTAADIEQWSQQRVSWPAAMATVGTALPNGRIDLSRWRCASNGDNQEMELEGHAASRSTVQAVGHRLAANPSFRVQPPESRSEQRGRFPESFRMKVQVIQPTSVPPVDD